MNNQDITSLFLCNIYYPVAYELLTSFCISNSEIYDMLKVYGDESAESTFESVFHVNTMNEDILSFKRLKNIVYRFAIDSIPDDSDEMTEKCGIMAKADKIYDGILVEEVLRICSIIVPDMFRNHNLDDSILELLPSIKHIPIETLLNKVGAVDFSSTDRRDKNFNILEAALYCELLHSTRGRSINTVNIKLLRKRDCDRAKRWFLKVGESMLSYELSQAIMCLLLDRLHNRTVDLYNDTENNSFGHRYRVAYTQLLRVYILSEFIALDILPVGDIPKSESGTNPFFEYFTKADFFDADLKTKLMTNDEWYHISEEEYSMANWLFETLLQFVDNVKESAAELLSCLPEAVVLEGKRIYGSMQEPVT